MNTWFLDGVFEFSLDPGIIENYNTNVKIISYIR